MARRFGNEKLYGTRLGHFAAFGLEEWRTWDWTCGRLDAQVHLARALVADQKDMDVTTRRAATQAWVAATQELTCAAELPDVGFAARRSEVWTLKNQALVTQLEGTPYGKALVLRVVDAVMRALPHDDALGQPGYLVNTLLARHPQQRWKPLWAALTRPLARRFWLRKVSAFRGGG